MRHFPRREMHQPCQWVLGSRSRTTLDCDCVEFEGRCPCRRALVFYGSRIDSGEVVEDLERVPDTRYHGGVCAVALRWS